LKWFIDLISFFRINALGKLKMDIELTMLNFSEDQLKFYLVEIKKSNLPKEVQWELTDLLETANQQIKQANAMGWLP
jgi:hypothetical protein